MTKEGKQEILDMYFSKGLELDEIAQATGEEAKAVYAVLSDPKALRPYMRKAAAARLRAQICVNERAEEAARKQAELIALGEAAGAQAVSQRAAKDILDRAGISTEAETEREIRITFAGMPRLGIPRTQEGGDDRCEA